MLQTYHVVKKTGFHTIREPSKTPMQVPQIAVTPKKIRTGDGFD